MKVSSSWLAEYLGADMPKPADVARLLTFHAFEVEGIEKTDSDTLFDIAVLPNRAHDCLSHRGIARELAAVMGAPMKKDSLREPVDLSLTSRVLSVTVDDPVRAPRYAAAVVRGVSVGPSPRWLRERLEALGQKSINNIVDATNFVLLDIGQPTHAFDLDTFSMNGGTCAVRIRAAHPGEKITTLDGAERMLPDKTIVIADGKSDAPLGIAGVKGGAHSAISTETKNIVIESANFNPVAVRKAAQALKLRTDASVRFENGLAPELAGHGLREVVDLILKIAGGSVEGYVDCYPRPRNPFSVGVSTDEVNRVLGTDLSARDVGRALAALGFPHETVKPVDAVLARARELVGVPYVYGASVSYDAPRSFDCSGFVSYLYACAGVALPRMAVDQFVFGREVSPAKRAPGDIIFSRGSDSEARQFTRVSDGVLVEQEVLQTESREFLPGTKVPGGVSHCGVYLGDGKVAHAFRSKGSGGVTVEDVATSDSFKNIVGYRRVAENEERFVITVPPERLDLRSREDLIEEIGRVRGYENVRAVSLTPLRTKPIVHSLAARAAHVRDALVTLGFSEVYTYVFRDRGDVALANALASDKGSLRNSLIPGLSESVELNARHADALGLGAVRIFEIGTVFEKEGEHIALALGLSVKKRAAADEELERATKAIADAVGVDVAKYETVRKGSVVEFNFSEAVGHAKGAASYPSVSREKGEARFKPISAYPFVLRDIAVWVPSGAPRNTLEDVVRESAGPLLVRLTPFDEFKKDGRTSYALRLVFQSHEKTLSDAEVGGLMEGVVSAVGKRGWEVR